LNKIIDVSRNELFISAPGKLMTVYHYLKTD